MLPEVKVLFSGPVGGACIEPDARLRIVMTSTHMYAHARIRLRYPLELGSHVYEAAPHYVLCTVSYLFSAPALILTL